MERNNWIKIKNERKYTLESLYEYWEKNKKPEYKNLSLEEFKINIIEYVNIGGVISSEKIEEYFDKKYFVIKIFNANGQLIKEI